MFEVWRITQSSRTFPAKWFFKTAEFLSLQYSAKSIILVKKFFPPLPRLCKIILANSLFLLYDAVRKTWVHNVRETR